MTKDRRCERQHRHEGDELDHAFGEAAAAAAGPAATEIDADVLRAGNARRQRESPRYTGRHRHETDAAADRAVRQVRPCGRPNKLAISCSRLS
jgi:hypothetical protein